MIFLKKTLIKSYFFFLAGIVVLLSADFALARGRSVDEDGANNSELKEALSLYEHGDLLPSASALFNLRNKSELRANKGLIYFTLGKIFLDLKMPQIAAWQFTNVLVANNDKYNRRALQLLASAADQLGDDTILNYAMSKMKISDFPSTEKDVLYFRLGEVKFRNKDYKGALSVFEKVSFDSIYGDQAEYMAATSLAMLNELDPAISRFQKLLGGRTKAITDDVRVSALMGLARAHYQSKNWEKSLSYYRKIPRDHKLWHQMLFESTWANLRAAKFRSALGNLHSLHSSYYDDFYVPESLLLRAIVYLYICKYDEVDKVISLYGKSYGDVQSRITNFLQATNDPMAYFSEAEEGLIGLKNVQMGKSSTEGRLPYRVTRHILRKPDMERGLDYLRKLYGERNKLEQMPRGFLQSPMGKYSVKLLVGRIKSVQKLLGIKMKIHLMAMKRELKDLQDQVGYIQYEIIGLQKEQLKNKMSGTGSPKSDYDDDTDRDEYVKNGYQYWPFRGEYWLDEIGNYFYVGSQMCKNEPL